MIMPIVAYGHPTLRKKAVDIDKDYPGLQQFIADMFETMYASNGVGLAAPQVNRSIRLFVIDATPYAEDFPGETNLKRVFINPRIIEEKGAKSGRMCSGRRNFICSIMTSTLITMMKS